MSVLPSRRGWVTRAMAVMAFGIPCGAKGFRGLRGYGVAACGFVLLRYSAHSALSSALAARLRRLVSAPRHKLRCMASQISPLRRRRALRYGCGCPGAFLSFAPGPPATVAPSCRRRLCLFAGANGFGFCGCLAPARLALHFRCGGGAGFRGLCAAAAALRASLAPLRSRPGAAWGRLRRPCSRSRSSVR